MNMVAKNQKRKTPLPLENPIEADCQWAAGFFEGEGYAGATHDHRYPRMALFRTTVSQINTEPLVRLQRFFGGSIHQQTMRTKPPLNRQPIHRWTLHGYSAFQFVLAIYPYLSVRRQTQIRQALNRTSTLPNVPTVGRRDSTIYDPAEVLTRLVERATAIWVKEGRRMTDQAAEVGVLPEVAERVESVRQYVEAKQKEQI